MAVTVAPRMMQRARATALHGITLLRNVGVAALAGLAAGFVAGGVGSRLAMRVSGFFFTTQHPGVYALTEADAQPGVITFEGTAFLLFFGTIIGVVGAPVYLALKPWLPGNGWRKGLSFGVVLLALAGPFVLDPNNIDFTEFGPPLVNVTLFSGLFIVYGLLLAPVDLRLDRRVRRQMSLQPPRLRTLAGTAVLVGVMLLGVLTLLQLTLLSIGAIVANGSIGGASLTHFMLLLTCMVAALVGRRWFDPRLGNPWEALHRRAWSFGQSIVLATMGTALLGACLLTLRAIYLILC